MSLSIYSLNARGLKDLVKRKALFLYCKSKGTDFCFIQETHACSTDESFWKNQWGSQIWFSNGSNRSAGIAILKDKFKGQVLHTEKDRSGRWIILVVDINHNQFILINIYATNSKINNIGLFQDIESKVCLLLHNYPSPKVIWGGDFKYCL